MSQRTEVTLLFARHHFMENKEYIPRIRDLTSCFPKKLTLSEEESLLQKFKISAGKDQAGTGSVGIKFSIQIDQTGFCGRGCPAEMDHAASRTKNS